MAALVDLAACHLRRGLAVRSFANIRQCLLRTLDEVFLSEGLIAIAALPV
jgi:hypothetical protein